MRKIIFILVAIAALSCCAKQETPQIIEDKVEIVDTTISYPTNEFTEKKWRYVREGTPFSVTFFEVRTDTETGELLPGHLYEWEVVRPTNTTLTCRGEWILELRDNSPDIIHLEWRHKDWEDFQIYPTNDPDLFRMVDPIRNKEEIWRRTTY